MSWIRIPSKYDLFLPRLRSTILAKVHEVDIHVHWFVSPTEVLGNPLVLYLRCVQAVDERVVDQVDTDERVS